jgi:hypothetical protein
MTSMNSAIVSAIMGLSARLSMASTTCSPIDSPLVIRRFPVHVGPCSLRLYSLSRGSIALR